MMKENRILIVIPARGGSKGIPRKNLRRVGGISLVGRAVLNALAFSSRRARGGSLVIVDTDDEDIAAEGRAWGAEVPFLRPAALARDETPTLDSVLHLAERVEREIAEVRTIVLLQPTSPLRTAADVELCWREYDPESARSVISLVRWEHPPQLSVRLGGAERRRIEWMFDGGPHSHRRQDLEPALRPSGAVYIDSLAFLREWKSFAVEGETVGVELPSERSLDIDTPADLEIAAHVLERDAPLPIPPRLQRNGASGVGFLIRAAASGDNLARSPAGTPISALLTDFEGDGARLSSWLSDSGTAEETALFVDAEALSRAQRTPGLTAMPAFRATRESAALVDALGDRMAGDPIIVRYLDGDEAVAFAIASSARAYGGVPVLLKDFTAAPPEIDGIRSLAPTGTALGLPVGAIVRSSGTAIELLAAMRVPLLFVEVGEEGELESLRHRLDTAIETRTARS